MKGAAIEVAALNKAYRVYGSPSDRLKHLLGFGVRSLDFEALSDVSFSVASGEAVGVIGENGAGKSTLLKTISGTTLPTSGTVAVHGVVAAILELNAAFHPEFTGRENAILYGALMGLDRADMLARLDTILEFAEIGPFVDRPIKSYSTGMLMRLAFAVATHVAADVIVVDEALAVGDGYFQKKCVTRMLEIKKRGTTILFCSHSMYYVTTFCDRAIWLRKGKIELDGPAQEVVTAYEEFLVNREKRRIPVMEEQVSAQSEQVSLPPGQQAMITGIRVLDSKGSEVQLYRPGMELSVEVSWETAEPEAEFNVGISLDRSDGTRVIGAATQYDKVRPLQGSGNHTVRVRFEQVPLAQGTYSVSAYLFDASGMHVYDQAVLTDYLGPASQSWAPALLDVPHRWSV